MKWYTLEERPINFDVDIILVRLTEKYLDEHDINYPFSLESKIVYGKVVARFVGIDLVYAFQIVSFGRQHDTKIENFIIELPLSVVKYWISIEELEATLPKDKE